jgi:hypothetical protein
VDSFSDGACLRPAEVSQLPLAAAATAGLEPAALREPGADLAYPRLPAGRPARQYFEIAGAVELFRVGGTQTPRRTSTRTFSSSSSAER